MELVPYSSKASKCRVCGTSPAQIHFNAETCKSCAAFFRRFVISKKHSIKCTCDQQSYSKYPCRLCRMKKCLAVGMNRALVQPARDKYASTSIVDTGPKITINHLVLLAFERVRKIKHDYDFVNNDREIMQASSIEILPGEVNYFELSCVLKEDFHLLSSMIVKTFPELDQLSNDERNVLFTNFYPKWNVFESALMEVKFNVSDSWFYETPVGERIFTMEDFYNVRNGNSEKLLAEQLSMFHQYWEFFIIDFKKLIGSIGFDEIEEMCVLALLFCDTGYTNLTPKSTELCENIRKCIYRELKAYCLEKNKEELRFFELLNTLPLIEKAEQKNLEELQLCCLHNVMVDPEYYEIMNTSKY